MSTSSTTNKAADTTRLGEHAAQQPLSGTTCVHESLVVNGLGHGAVRKEETNAELKRAS